jgi:hypothetical protein
VSLGISRQEVPDMILVNGLVFTGAQARPYVDAIAIKGARILAVGTSQEVPGVRRRAGKFVLHYVVVARAKRFQLATQNIF